MSLTGDPADLLEFAGRLADAGRPIALEHFRSGRAADNKADAGFDPVTAADIGVETAIRALIARERPEDGVLGEEGEPAPSRSGLTWVIDPIDGTRAFIAGLPTWTILIGLQDDTGPILSVIDQPFTAERFSGLAGREAWLDHQGGRRRITARQTARRLDDAVLSTTDPGLFDADEAEAFAGLARAAKVRRYGLDAYGYAALALGGVDLVVESGLKAWDVTALVPVVTGAGGVISDWSGGPCHAGGQIVAAANSALHSAALQALVGAAR